MSKHLSSDALAKYSPSGRNSNSITAALVLKMIWICTSKYAKICIGVSVGNFMIRVPVTIEAVEELPMKTIPYFHCFVFGTTDIWQDHINRQRKDEKKKLFKIIEWWYINQSIVTCGRCEFGSGRGFCVNFGQKHIQANSTTFFYSWSILILLYGFTLRETKIEIPNKASCRDYCTCIIISDTMNYTRKFGYINKEIHWLSHDSYFSSIIF